MSVKLLTEHHLEFLSLNGSESKLVKMPHYWKSHVAGHLCISEAKGGQRTEPGETPRFDWCSGDLTLGRTTLWE